MVSLAALLVGCTRPSLAPPTPSEIAASQRCAPVVVTYPPEPVVPPTTAVAPNPPVSQAAASAVAISLTANEQAKLGEAYISFTGLDELFDSGPPYTDPFPVQPVLGTLHAAVITGTGVRWAFARMEPKPGCTVKMDGRRINPVHSGPFAGGATSAGVFEQDPGGPWIMNYFETAPFPCPEIHPPVADGHGLPTDSPWVPPAVLTAVGVPYARTGCNTVYIPIWD